MVWPTTTVRAARAVEDRAAVEILRKGDGGGHMELVTLWRAVILNALHDAFVLKAGSHNNNDADVSFSERLEVLQWLFMPGGDFLTVCELADINPLQIRRTAVELERLPREDAKKRVRRLLSCSEKR